MPTANAPALKPNNYDTAFRPILRNPGRIQTENDCRLYFQAVASAHDYSDSDVKELLEACSDDEKIKLDLYYKQYVSTTHDRQLRPKNDKTVMAIATLFDLSARKASKKFLVLND